MTTAAADFWATYAAHRAAEGRQLSCSEMLAVPYLPSRQWAVRARTFDAFVRLVDQDDTLRVLDLGAGSGWLSYRLTLAGHECVAVDVRDDDVDGLGASFCYRGFERVVASFDALPLDSHGFDIAVFNAALHYALDLGAVLREARRMVRPGGRIVILDSPFYPSAADGEQMVAEKRHVYPASPAFIEYLTRERLQTASPLDWRRHRVWYPMWYEMRPLVARIRRRRRPSRFDLWECVVP
ncbi:MAG TPA: class I SAM-dependent methyltransferase [Gemmatimonadaceae bacterium]|nr:class I SAM-dependent methyltransferase [Gemmatimonadaceae bacterium]